LKLLVFLNIWLILIETVGHKFIDVVIVSQMDPSLVKDVGLHVVWSLFGRNSYLGETKTGHKAVLFEDLVLVDFVSSEQRLSKRLELLDVSLSFSWTKTTQELELVL
jgi:hypothetical protein